MRKGTIEDMHKIAKKREGVCLSKIYVNSVSKLKWKCKEGHKWFSVPSHISFGGWCPRCAGVAKYTIKDVKALAKEKGGKCLSKVYVNANTKLQWKCKEGHKWHAASSDIRQGSWCSYCAGTAKLNIEQMQELAEARGGRCLSPSYVNKKTNMKWACKKKHIWEAPASSIKHKGSWCPYCVGRNKTIEDMHVLAESKDGRCLSKKYVNSDTKLKWRCKEHHEWYARPASISRGSWCPYCDRKHVTIEDMQELAKIRGGQCLSKEYITSKTKLKWKCKDGHIWKAIPNKIQMGGWCRICSQRVSERICRGFFETIFQKKFPTLKPSWLINSRSGRMELDGYSKDLGLAFEYHGKQHYSTVSLFTPDEKALAQRKEDDKLKRTLCEKHNVVLIEVPYTVSYEDMDDYIIKKCKKGKVNVPKITKKIDYKLLDVFSPQKIKEMKELAKIHGGYCLSKNYVNTNTKLKWQCKEGHEWNAIPTHIRIGHWCPYCVGKNKTIEDMQELAKSRGGECLSSTYVNSQTKLKWQCKEGHEWEAISASISFGRWCIRCAGKSKLTIEEMRTWAKEKGGRCLSKKYINNSTKLKWVCKEGHKWETAPTAIQRGTWCPYCAGIVRKTIQDAINLAKSKEGLCLSDIYVNAHGNLSWQCKEGHVWEASYNRVQQGGWCPKCSKLK